MRVKKMIAAATLPAMIASPVIAASDNPASSLSLRGDSDAAGQPAQSEPPAPIPVPPVEAASTGGIPTALLIGGVVIAAVIVGALVLGHNSNNNHPASA